MRQPSKYNLFVTDYQLLIQCACLNQNLKFPIVKKLFMRNVKFNNLT